LKSEQDRIVTEKITRLLENNHYSAENMAEWCVGLLDSVEQGIVITDKYGVIQYVNPAYT
jgi:PAS domain-containing protein